MSYKFNDILGNTWETDCLGCDIGNKKIIPPGGIIYETDMFVVHQDPEVPICGFLIIATKEHVNSITQMNDEQRNEFISLVNKSISTLKKLGITKEVTIVQEERSRHFHTWVFPWQDWMDDQFTKSLSSLREINKYAKNNIDSDKIQKIKDTVTKIRQEISN